MLSAAEAIIKIYNSILKQGSGIPIEANTQIVTEKYGVCSIEQATCFVITEEGTAKCFIYPYSNADIATKLANSWNCCWVLFNMQGDELSFGGLGFAVPTCRMNGLNWLLEYLKKKQNECTQQKTQEQEQMKEEQQ